MPKHRLKGTAILLTMEATPRVDIGNGRIVEICTDRNAQTDGQKCGPKTKQRLQTQPTESQPEDADLERGETHHIECAGTRLDVRKEEAGEDKMQAVDHQQAGQQRDAARAVRPPAAVRPQHGGATSARPIRHRISLCLRGVGEVSASYFPTR